MILGIQGLLQYLLSLLINSTAIGKTGIALIIYVKVNVEPNTFG